jgi:hypothetical protein
VKGSREELLEEFDFRGRYTMQLAPHHVADGRSLFAFVAARQRLPLSPATAQRPPAPTAPPQRRARSVDRGTSPPRLQTKHRNPSYRGVAIPMPMPMPILTRSVRMAASSLRTIPRSSPSAPGTMGWWTTPLRRTAALKTVNRTRTVAASTAPVMAVDPATAVTAPATTAAATGLLVRPAERSLQPAVLPGGHRPSPSVCLRPQVHCA